MLSVCRRRQVPSILTGAVYWGRMWHDEEFRDPVNVNAVNHQCKRKQAIAYELTCVSIRTSQCLTTSTYARLTRTNCSWFVDNRALLLLYVNLRSTSHLIQVGGGTPNPSPNVRNAQLQASWCYRRGNGKEGVCRGRVEAFNTIMYVS